MEPDFSLPHSQEAATYPYPEPDKSSHRSPNVFLEYPFNFFSHLRLCIPSGLLPSGFPRPKTVCTSPVPHTCYMHRQFHSFVDQYNSWGFSFFSRLQCSCASSILRSKYPPRPSIPEHPRPRFLPQGLLAGEEIWFLLFWVLMAAACGQVHGVMYRKNCNHNVGRIERLKSHLLHDNLRDKNWLFFWYFAHRASQYIYLNINQLDALNFIMSLFHASTCFEHKC